MQQSDATNNQRRSQRVEANLPIQLSFGSQITLTGQMKDLSLKSAFVVVKASVSMQINDDLTFMIQGLSGDPADSIQGAARISRVAAGEGIAIYFTQMDESSANRLRGLINAR